MMNMRSLHQPCRRTEVGFPVSQAAAFFFFFEALPSSSTNGRFLHRKPLSGPEEPQRAADPRLQLESHAAAFKATWNPNAIGLWRPHSWVPKPEILEAC